ncbi:MAG: D-sedoheptulose-7-phosphate isomerase [Planctomycetota bacterium]|jgi:D-sedoheptulose 7-phosphate isomerase
MDKSIEKQVKAAIDIHKKMVAELESGATGTIAAAAEAIIKSIKQGGVVYICGNGGSAADAQHIAGEFVGRFERERKGLAAIALTTDTSVMTSISNDYGYENVFARQVEALVRKGDVLWAISTSGSSPNVVAAAEMAKKKGACVLAFTGQAESKLERVADICFCAADKSTAHSQEIHQIAYHIICELVEQNFCE